MNEEDVVFVKHVVPLFDKLTGGQISKSIEEISFSSDNVDDTELHKKVKFLIDEIFKDLK